ncbi:MAG: family 78 glycoside hydrolase catalytic domain [Clostridia bacterium]|nr:family 78 glycoside hydrolase catalytic domain [Clostridia bacterium]
MLTKWITTKAKTAPVIRRRFTIETTTNATLAICGLGFFEAYINGKPVTDELFNPVWSDYTPRENRRMLYPIHDTFAHRVYYRVYKVSHLLQQGENTLEVTLGNGWFNQRERNVEGDFWYGEPMLSFAITVDGQTVESDEQCEYRESHIVFNNIYMGETHDYRGNVTHWQPCEFCEPPKGKLQEQTCPCDGVIRTIAPKLLWQKGDESLYDMGENITGHVRFLQEGDVGCETVLRFCENLNTDGTPNFDSCQGSQIQTDRCIGGGAPVWFAPHFTWHGFRYVHIQGPATHVQGVVVHSRVAVTSTFDSSDATLNWLYETYLRTQLDNMHCGVPMDCPHRERLGYTGDGQVCCDTGLLLLDSAAFYKKWMQDIADCQDPNGHVQHTAPFYGGGGGPGGWGGAIVAVPYFYYRHTLDSAVLTQYFPRMARWVAYMESRCENGLVVREEEGGWCLGEWCTPDSVKIDPAFVNTYFLIKNLQRMAELACCLGQDPTPWQEKAQFHKVALHKAFYQPDGHTYGAQGADAFALDIGLGDDAMFDRLAEHYNETRQFDTGIFGTEILLDLLFSRGRGKTALFLLTSHKEHTFGYMMDAGATTLWERWQGVNSHNHPMFGACTKQLFYGVLGIHTFEDMITVAPQADSLPQMANGSLTTRNGTVFVAYQKQDDTVTGTVRCDKPLRLILPDGEQILPPNQEISFEF